MKIFAFWHDKEKIPPYLQLCFETWEKFIKSNEIILLDYNNLDDYTDIRQQDYWEPLTSGKYKKALIADVIRVDLLCKYGGLWMDMDTIITSPEFENKYLNPDSKYENEIFAMKRKMNSVAYMRCKKDSKFLQKLKAIQIRKIKSLPENKKPKWNYLANSFTNPYMTHFPSEFKIMNIAPCWPEYVKSGFMKETRCKSYKKLYFQQNLNLSDFPPTSILMLHNSWTPPDYKTATKEEVLAKNCTLSNILRELTQ